MMKRAVLIALIGLMLTGAFSCLSWKSTPAAAEWPNKVFAPYAYIPKNSKNNIMDCFNETGQKYFTLAFIIANSAGEPAWDGQTPLDENYYADQIAAIRAKGGDVLVSFGGEAPPELALKAADATSLQAKYQAVIDKYKFTWLDFDIEGRSMKDVKINQMRNEAIAGLQKKNPGLRISYTLAVNPTGMEEDSLAVLLDAKAQGVKVYSANIMTMDYGAKISAGKKMGDLAVLASNASYKQVQEIDPAIRIGITPMIGQNDEKTEYFSVDDAKTVYEFAKKTPWVCSVGFWQTGSDMPRTRRPRPAKKGATATPTPTPVPTPAPTKWAYTNVFKPLSGN